MTSLETGRLLSRPWQAADVEPFAQMSADPDVMHFFGGPQTRDLVATIVEKAMAHQARFGIWMQPVILKKTGEFIGMAGIAEVMFEAHFTPAVEIGWRLARQHWGHGYVTEIGRAFIDHAFASRRLSELVSFAVQDNIRSIAVMNRLGFTHDPADDFDHPRVGEDMPHLRRHVLYRLKAPIPA